MNERMDERQILRRNKTSRKRKRTQAIGTPPPRLLLGGWDTELRVVFELVFLRLDLPGSSGGRCSPGVARWPMFPHPESCVSVPAAGLNDHQYDAQQPVIDDLQKVSCQSFGFHVVPLH